MNQELSVSMIVIGDEILSGRTSDLNGSWLCKFLFRKGLQFKSMRFIKDSEEAICASLKEAFSESDIVITSGGIGPTRDDKTKKTLAHYFNKKIIPRDDVAKIVTQNYVQFGRIWQPTQNFYHHFPEDFIATNNPRGLAPGIAYFDETTKKLVMSGPGVPREFTEIVEQEFFPLIQHYFSDKIAEFHQTVIRTNGVAEEKIFTELCPTLWADLEKYGKVSSLPHTIGIDIVVSYSSTYAIHQKYEQQIRELIEASALSSHVWQYGNVPINELVLKCASERQLTFSLAESCTGGLTASKVTDLPGSSTVFMGAVVSYSNEAKCELLDVSAETIAKHGAVSSDTATEMAQGARLKFKTDFAVSLTGIAGPTGGSEKKPAGTVVIGFASKSKAGALTYQFPGDRVRRKERFSDMALLVLLRLMEGKL